MRFLLAAVLASLPSLALTAQSLTVPMAPERVLDTVALFGFPLRIVQPVEADGYVVTEEFLLRDDLREPPTNLYYLVSIRPDGIYCSPGWHPQVVLPAAFRLPMTTWPIQGIHRLFLATAKGVEAQYPLPFATMRCG